MPRTVVDLHLHARDADVLLPCDARDRDRARCLRLPDAGHVVARLQRHGGYVVTTAARARHDGNLSPEPPAATLAVAARFVC